jgi:DNA mismatch endonuclease (patch repair protein)
MTDVVDSKTRSKMMASIGQKGTRPELLVRRYLHAAGLRFRLHAKHLPGTPDLVLSRYRTAIFVHGCFWHRHQGCRFCTIPATRPEFWSSKFASNVKRDLKATAALGDAGWRVLTIWECEAEDELALDRLFWHVVTASGITALRHGVPDGNRRGCSNRGTARPA